MAGMTPFQVVIGAARKALLDADDHAKVAHALTAVALEIDEGQAAAKRVTQHETERRELDVVINALRGQLKDAGIEPIVPADYAPAAPDEAPHASPRLVEPTAGG